jgi:hypothetical protein
MAAPTAPHDQAGGRVSMNWFVLAAILGFAAPRGWRWLGSAGRWWLAMTVAAIACLAAVIVGPMLLFSGAYKNFHLQTDWINNPTFTRVLLGLILGAGADYVSRQAPSYPGQASDQKPSSAVGLSIAASIVLLALVAPHVDGWLSHLSGFKTSLIEIQLTNLSSTSKAVKPAQREGFIRDIALKSLAEYDESIEKDIDFIKRFELEDIAEQKKHTRDPGNLVKREQALNAQLEQLEKLRDYFEHTVSPASRCFKAAIDHGLSLERARYHLRALADAVTQLILLEQEEKRRPEFGRPFWIDLQHLRVLWLLANATNDVAGFVDPTDQKICHLTPPTVLTPIPHWTDYDLLPHLDVARALLLVFVNHDHLGLKVLREADQKEFKDFNTAWLLALLMYYRGDSITQYYDGLEGLRNLSRDRMETINHVNRKCGSICDQELLTQKLKERAQKADLVATNDIAYGIAVDVAEGSGAAEDLLPIAEQYVETLKKSESNLEKPLILDTIAFVTIVAEAHKGKTSSLDKAKIGEAMALLTRAAAHEEVDLSAKSLKGENVDYSTLRTIRAHIESGRGLLE